MSAFSKLKDQVTKNHNYAHSLYCNLKMPMIDSGIKIELAEKAAQNIMSSWFGLKEEQYKHYIIENK